MKKKQAAGLCRAQLCRSRRHAAGAVLVIAALLGACRRPLRRRRRFARYSLGDNGHHQPAERAAVLIPAMQKAGIEVTYTDKLADLNRQESGPLRLLDRLCQPCGAFTRAGIGFGEYVKTGHGFVPIHYASACFTKSKKYVELVGGQFERHGTGVFRPQIVQPEHPIMLGFHDYEVWDETYRHRLLTPDRQVLMVHKEADHVEPWAWVRTQGKGRVFYTASGHDDRCWRNPGFLNLIERAFVGRPVAIQPWPAQLDDPLAFEMPKMTPPSLRYEAAGICRGQNRVLSARRKEQAGAARGTRCNCRWNRPNR